jgi:hypothetical protein
MRSFLSHINKLCEMPIDISCRIVNHKLKEAI